MEKRTIIVTLEVEAADGMDYPAFHVSTLAAILNRVFKAVWGKWDYSFKVVSVYSVDDQLHTTGEQG